MTRRSVFTLLTAVLVFQISTAGLTAPVPDADASTGTTVSPHPHVAWKAVAGAVKVSERSTRVERSDKAPAVQRRRGSSKRSNTSPVTLIAWNFSGPSGPISKKNRWLTDCDFAMWGTSAGGRTLRMLAPHAPSPR